MSNFILCNVHIPGDEAEDVLLAAIPRIGERLCLGNDDVSTTYEVIGVEYLGFDKAPKANVATVRLHVKQVRTPRVGGRRT